MTSIVLKIILAIVLTLIPFIYRYGVKPLREEKPELRNIFTYLHAIQKRLWNFYNWMKYSKNFRNFHILIFVMLALATQFVEMQASKQVYYASAENLYLPQSLLVKDSLTSFGKATSLSITLSFLLTMPFFDYKFTDKVLTYLSERLWAFIALSVLSFTLLFVFPGCYAIGTTIYIFLLAATNYPRQDEMDGVDIYNALKDLDDGEGGTTVGLT